MQPYLDSTANVYLHREGGRFEPDKLIHENYLRGRISNQEIREIANQLEERLHYFYFRYLWILLPCLIVLGGVGFILALNAVISERDTPFWYIHVDVFGTVILCFLLCCIIGKLSQYYEVEAQKYLNIINGDLVQRRIRVTLLRMEYIRVTFLDDTMADPLAMDPQSMVLLANNASRGVTDRAAVAPYPPPIPNSYGGGGPPPGYSYPPGAQPGQPVSGGQPGYYPPPGRYGGAGGGHRILDSMGDSPGIHHIQIGNPINQYQAAKPLTQAIAEKGKDLQWDVVLIQLYCTEVTKSPRSSILFFIVQVLLTILSEYKG
eukprot:TRINITY_DN1390_c0_g1_i5.p1 TRINITY_DN1390_c0_g1~~TRINITY_DN1390_c0_g1_i5.p1  ORF type:complete len:318 (+),score=32.29 TRINITY_DN1390_c0_g1_i5:660-1613(+)